jgi:hypothetical protein
MLGFGAQLPSGSGSGWTNYSQASGLYLHLIIGSELKANQKLIIVVLHLVRVCAETAADSTGIYPLTLSDVGSLDPYKIRTKPRVPFCVRIAGRHEIHYKKSHYIWLAVDAIAVAS